MEGRALALSGSTSLLWFDTYAELRAQSGGATNSDTNIAIGRDPGFGGVFAWTTDTSTADNGGTVIVPTATPRTGCWKRLYEGGVNVKWFGAIGDGATPDTTAVQNAVDFASAVNKSVVIPPGTYRVSNIGIYAKSVLLGAGREVSVLKQIRASSGPTGALISRKSSASGRLDNCLIRDLKLLGDDGYGGIGLELVSFANSTFENLHVSSFRESSGHTGVGISLTNSSHGGCYGNAFVSIMIGDSNTGLLIDSASGSSASGYNRFFGLTIYQENDCISIKNTAGNGGIYNLFSGVLLQGTSAGGKGVYCQGGGNTFVNLIEDGVPGNNIELTSTASGNVFLSPWVNGAKVVNNASTGAMNTIYGLGTWVGGLGQSFVIQDLLTGATTLQMYASGSANGPEIRLGTDASALQWRMSVSNGTSSAYFSLVQGLNVVERWNTNRSSLKYGDLIFDASGSGVQLKDRTTGAAYRLKVDNGVLGIEAV